MLKIKDLDEEFVDIKGYEGRYKVGNKGTILGLSRSNDERYKDNVWLLKQYEDSNGYMYVTLSNNKKRKTIKVHRLVAEAFLDNPNNYPCVNHIDSNRTNNEVENLEFCTHKQNIQHAYKNHRFDNMRKINSERIKLNPLNGYIYANKLTKKRVGKFDEFGCIEIYESISEASRKTGISIASISYSANGKRATGGGYIWHFV